MVSAFVGDVVSDVSGNCRDTFVESAEVGVVTALPNCWVDAEENVFMFASNAGFGRLPSVIGAIVVRDASTDEIPIWVKLGTSEALACITVVIMPYYISP